MINAIIPECYVDTCLVNVLLGLEKASVNHGKGNTTVTQKMKDRFNDKFCVAIIDNDKRKVDYLKECEQLNNTIEDYAILFKHKAKHHFIIMLCPESETWICKVAKQLSINMLEDYSLPDTPTGLSKMTKNVKSKDDISFINLFKQIVKEAETHNFEPVLKLKYWLNYLADNNYQVDVNNLRK